MDASVRQRALRAAAAAAAAAAEGATPAQADRLAGEAAGAFAEAVAGLAAAEATGATAAVADVDAETPDWGGLPPPDTTPFTLETIKGGVVVAPPTPLPVDGAGRVTVGRTPDAGLIIEHASASRRHAVLQLRARDGALFVRDGASAHGTFIGAARLPPGRWARLRAGDVLRFGASTRRYVVGGGPSEDEAEPAARPDTAAAAAADMRRALQKRGDGSDGDSDPLPHSTDWRSLHAAGRLTGRAAALATRVDKARKRAAALRAEADAIRSKTTLDSITPGQAAVLARNDGAADALEADADEAEDALEGMLAARQEDGDTKRRRASSSDDDDDFYDRTHTKRAKAPGADKAAAVTDAEPALDAATLVARRDALRAERAAAVAEAEKVRARAAAAGGNDAHTHTNDDDDALDAFMAGVNSDAAADAVAAADAAVAAIDQQIADTDRLIRIADPDGWVVGGGCGG